MATRSTALMHDLSSRTTDFSLHLKLAGKGFGQTGSRLTFVQDGSESVLVECSLLLLKYIRDKDAADQLLLEVTSSFHERHGCSVRTMLSMLAVCCRTLDQLMQQGDLSATDAWCHLSKLISQSLSIMEQSVINLPSHFEVVTIVTEKTTPLCLIDPSYSAAEHRLLGKLKYSEGMRTSSTRFDGTTESLENDCLSTKTSLDAQIQITSHKQPTQILLTPSCSSASSNVNWLNNSLQMLGLSKSTANHEKVRLKSRHYQRPDDFHSDPNNQKTSYTSRILVGSKEPISTVIQMPQKRGCEKERFNHAWSVTLNEFVIAICREDEICSRLLVECLISLADYRLDYLASSLKNVSIVKCIGPSKSASTTVSGIVLSLENSALPIFMQSGEPSAKLSVMLLQGDLTSSYKHLGYKRSVVTQEVVGVNDIKQSPSSWCDMVLSCLIQHKVDMILIKGFCDSTIKMNASVKGIIIVENVAGSVLKALANASDVPVLHYIEELEMEHLMSVAASLMTQISSAQDRLLLSINPLNYHTSPSQFRTIVMCSPVKSECAVIEERLHHCLSRLRSSLTSRSCLKGGCATEKLVITTILSTPVEVEERWLAKELFISELRTLISTASEMPPEMTNGFLDDYTTKVDAWKTALQVSKLFMALGLLVKTGLGNSRADF